MSIIELKNVNQEYGLENHIFKATNNVNFTIEEGEFVVILGLSGVGKSRFLNLIGGLDSVTSGEIIVTGEHVELYDDNQLTSFSAKNVGFIFQFYNSIPNLTTLENIELMEDIMDININGLEVLGSVELKITPITSPHSYQVENNNEYKSQEQLQNCPPYFYVRN